MSTGTEDFDQLRKLLKIKTHEQPPPGYFDHLAGRVMHRLENERRTGDFGFKFSWLKRLQHALAANPISAGILGVCGVFMVVVANYDFQYTGAAAPLNLGSAGGDSLADRGNGAVSFKMASTPAQPIGTQTANVNPLLPIASGPDLNNPLSTFPSLQAQPVSFSAGQ